MVPNNRLVKIAERAFNPYAPGSGTEHVATLLYALTRMARPLTVIERGSGYTTLFLLSALAENVADAQTETEELRRKTAALGDLETLKLGIEHPAIASWYVQGGRACAVDPGYYLQSERVPHLYSFEAHSEKHSYSKQMTRAVNKLGIGNYITCLRGCPFSASALPKHALPIDLAWNDDDQYQEFFDELWPLLNPSGGLMIFHNTVAVPRWWECITAIIESHHATGDLEVLTLVENHKINQNSCTIFRRTTEFRPSYVTRTPDRIIADTKSFMHARAKHKPSKRD